MMRRVQHDKDLAYYLNKPAVRLKIGFLGSKMTNVSFLSDRLLGVIG